MDNRPDVVFEGDWIRTPGDVEQYCKQLLALSRRPSLPEANPLSRWLFLHAPVGGCLHVVLDEPNYKSAPWCMEYAREIGCDTCMWIARVVSRLSPTQVSCMDTQPADTWDSGWRCELGRRCA